MLGSEVEEHVGLKKNLWHSYMISMKILNMIQLESLIPFFKYIKFQIKFKLNKIYLLL